MDSLTLCFRFDCPKHQNSVAEGCQKRWDNGVPHDVYMYSRLKDSYWRAAGNSRRRLPAGEASFAAMPMVPVAAAGAAGSRPRPRLLRRVACRRRPRALAPALAADVGAGRQHHHSTLQRQRPDGQRLAGQVGRGLDGLVQRARSLGAAAADGLRRHAAAASHSRERGRPVDALLGLPQHCESPALVRGRARKALISTHNTRVGSSPSKTASTGPTRMARGHAGSLMARAGRGRTSVPAASGKAARTDITTSGHHRSANRPHFCRRIPALAGATTPVTAAACPAASTCLTTGMRR